MRFWISECIQTQYSWVPPPPRPVFWFASFSPILFKWVCLGYGGRGMANTTAPPLSFLISVFTPSSLWCNTLCQAHIGDIYQ